MSRRVVFEPEASVELEEAALWYESQRSGLGLAFLAAVDRAVEQIAAWPDAGTSVPGVSADLAVRQLPVLRFPYRIAYVVASQEVWVLAVAHVRRRPGYWRSRSRDDVLRVAAQRVAQGHGPNPEGCGQARRRCRSRPVIVVIDTPPRRSMRPPAGSDG